MKAKTTVVGLFVLTLIATFGSHCIGESRPIISLPSSIPSSPPHTAQRWGLFHPDGWMAEKWTGDDKPYQKIRANIDKALSAGENPDRLAVAYEQKAQLHLKNPQAVYAWAYASWRAIKSTTHDNNYNRLARVIVAMAELPSPKTYEFTRMHFLALAWVTERAELKDVGLRLLQQNPNDYSVKYQASGILTITFTGQDKVLALKYAQDLIQMRPNTADPYGLLGSIYLRSYDQNHTKNKEDGEKAASAYEEYLKRAPANDPWRSQAESLIKSIRQS